MEIGFWVIAALVVLLVVYMWARGFRRRKETAAADTKEHGVDLQARRKTFDDVT